MLFFIAVDLNARLTSIGATTKSVHKAVDQVRGSISNAARGLAGARGEQGVRRDAEAKGQDPNAAVEAWMTTCLFSFCFRGCPL